MLVFKKVLRVMQKSRPAFLTFELDHNEKDLLSLSCHYFGNAYCFTTRYACRCSNNSLSRAIGEHVCKHCEKY